MKFNIKGMMIGVSIGLLIFPVIISICVYLSVLFGVNPITGNQDIYEIFNVGYQITQNDIDAYKKLENVIYSVVELSLYLGVALGIIGLVSNYLDRAVNSILWLIESKITKKS
jgi:hypothetical protein